MPDLTTVLVNGRSSDRLSVTDRGLAYGDGLFETISVVGGKPYLWQKHLNRLLLGCNYLGIVFKESLQLEEEVFSLSRQAKEQGVIKVIITRGSPASGYRIHSKLKTSRIVQLQKRRTFSSDLYKEGIAACFCKQRLAHSPELAKIKHLCRLEQVLARMEWQDEYHEGIMFDYDNNAIEGTMSNLFIVKGAALKTPRLDNCGVQGVMREWILEQCDEHHIAVEETEIDRQLILEADGLFFCNALIRVWPVRSIEAHRYDIGIVHRLLRRFSFSELGIAV